jgi:RNA recognition motif-containing protein
VRRSAFKATIIVSNLPDDVTAGELAELFDDYGLVLGAMIKRSEDAAGKAPRGMVNLAPKNAVEAAIRALDGTVVRARHLRVRKAPEDAPRPAGQGSRPRARKAPPAEAVKPADTAVEAAAFAPVRATVRRTFTVERRSITRPSVPRS